MLSSRVQSFIRLHGLLRPDATHLVALSGGADSVALLLLLQGLGYRIEAVHCNFHLRGPESDRDEQFCTSLCQQEHIALHLAHFDTLAYASAHGVSIEMAARDLRYTYFEQLRRDIGADEICVAHHRDDSVETVLLNLVRGTGIDGLTGIAPRRGHVVRPLLCVSRADIEAYLAAKGQDYVTDSTNLVDDVKRNKIRLDVIPLLQTLNPSVSDAIWRMSCHLAEAQKMADRGLPAEPLTSGHLSIAALRREPSPEYVLWRRLSGLHFTSEQIREMVRSLDAGSGRIWVSSTHMVAIDRDRLVIEENETEAPHHLLLSEPGVYLHEGQRIRVEQGEVDAHFSICRDRHVAMLDASLVQWPLCVRRVQTGDRFVPLGMKGSKLVSDFLTDRKVSVLAKRRQMVVTDASGRIVWLVGERLDHRLRITPDTHRYLKISWEHRP